MNNLARTNIHQLVEVANELTQQQGITRIITSFGVWRHDDNKQPLVYQVDVTIKEVGGEHTRTERGFYFVPTTMPDHALLIAKSMATLDFFNSKYPEIEMETQVGSEKVEDKISEERQSQTQASDDKAESVDSQPSEKKKRGRKPKVVSKVEVSEEVVQPVVEEATTLSEDNEAYDNTKVAHKDALIALLDKEFSNWRQLGKERTKAMSSALVGKPFLDKSGVIVESFRELIKSHIG